MTPCTFIKGALLLSMYVFCPSCKCWIYFLYLCKKYMYIMNSRLDKFTIIHQSGGEYPPFTEPQEMAVSISRPAIHRHWVPEVKNCFSTKPVNSQRPQKIIWSKLSWKVITHTRVHFVLQTSGYHRISWAWVANQSVWKWIFNGLVLREVIPTKKTSS